MNKNRTALALVAVAILVLSGCTWGFKSNNGMQNAFQLSPNKKLYTSEKYKFSLQYPASWQINEDGDRAVSMFVDYSKAILEKEMASSVYSPALNLELQYDFQVGDVGMGWKEFKTQKYTNPQGINFELSFNGFDTSFDKSADTNIVIIGIGTDAIPGLKIFSYDKSINPDGELQLMEVLDTVTKLDSGPPTVNTL